MYKNAKTKKWAKKHPNGYRGKNYTKKPDADDGYEGLGILQQEKEAKENLRELKRLEVARRQRSEEFVPTVTVKKKGERKMESNKKEAIALIREVRKRLYESAGGGRTKESRRSLRKSLNAAIRLLEEN